MQPEFAMPTERDSDGLLPTFAWPGGYPLFYVTKRSDILCAECATKALDDPDEDEKDKPEACDTNWEDAFMFCDECGKQIECAYCDEDEDEDQD